MSQYSESTKRALLSIPIVGVLAVLGKRTDRPSSHGPFYSPLREEMHPSFQINTRDNVWTDWGTGERGGVLDLVCRIRGCSRYEAMDFLAGLDAVHVETVSQSVTRQSEEEQSIIIDSSSELRSLPLLRYGQSRGIDAALLRRFCNEVRFHFVRTGSSFYSLGFVNNLGGFVLRNGLEGSASKLSSRPSGITTFNSSLQRTAFPESDRVMVLEGFMDFLSLMMMDGNCGADVCVLNSGANIGAAMDYLSNHETVSLLLDNDPAGDIYTGKIIDALPGARVLDCRASYSEYNDLNDLLLGHPGVRKPSCHQKAQDTVKLNSKTNQL